MIVNFSYTDEELDFHVVALRRSLTLLEQRLTKHRFLCSDQITIADLSAASELESSRFVDLDISNFPKTKEWLHRMIDENPVMDELHKLMRKTAKILVKKQREEGTLPRLDIRPSMEYQV
mmetsp:Transcript_41692/g.54912  ORF Transcript_41692/g.54912 Transcript_41692/m.54912 type:complete len:120 (-) Transcript_41692:72-431(-)|eukprot:CAMPEP_0185568670 /NCGR_PEP_ID=MMETSP0434-20130131/1564_1 /TAXON_ID=626734 ORGANISM="Favella taraikaensis, Strain Fe Narragansett Bay" /NCGR_SAMPLE_ID=MMETSP0434 /ASSEMBLY_ACC=CAM_ASM_000379 /LENGTH=119 /DNA_ID=CAMNT_0028183259 /DNA_START=338 /DNA_END=697 /DNA_ORIENTATION=-